MTPPRDSTQAPAQHRSRTWLLATVPVLMVLMYLVPYTLLSDVDAWYGSALFWTLTTAAVIAINVILSADWED